MKRFSIIAFGMALAATPALAGATFTTVDVAGVFTIVTGLNKQGAVTGQYNEAGAHGFLRTPDGTITKFEVDATETHPSAINDGDVITGTTFNPDNGKIKGFVRAADGTTTSFDPSNGGGGTFPVAINNKGQIAGYYVDGEGNTSGFVRSPNGTIDSFAVDETHGQPAAINKKGIVTGTVFGQTEMGFLRAKDGATTTFAAAADAHGTESNAINNEGWTAGRYLNDRFRTRGFLRDPQGNVTTVSVRGARRTSVLAINGDHATAGGWEDASSSHSFLRKANSNIVAFDPPDATWSQATGINDDGVVIGNYQTADSIVRGYIRNP